jgi:hypothetical protein
MARYFKIVEIDEDTFVDATGDGLDCDQMVVSTDGVVYVGINECEDEMDIPLDCFD